MWIETTLSDSSGDPRTGTWNPPEVEKPIEWSSKGTAQVASEVGETLIQRYDAIQEVGDDADPDPDGDEGDGGDNTAVSLSDDPDETDDSAGDVVASETVVIDPGESNDADEADAENSPAGDDAGIETNTEPEPETGDE